MIRIFCSDQILSRITYPSVSLHTYPSVSAVPCMTLAAGGMQDKEIMEFIRFLYQTNEYTH